MPCGFGIYLWVNYHVTGHIFAFNLLEEGWPTKHLATP